MSYDLCGKEWDQQHEEAMKRHKCVEMQGHFFHCVCKCGTKKLIRDVPLRKWEPKPVRSRRNRSMV